MISAFYNEIDPYAAQWTRNLIAAGHVAPGVVDDRSIVDLCPDDVAGPGQRHFFAGIGVWSYALRLAGVPDDADIWTASCPCQPFSGAGQRRGFADERHLWPVLRNLVAECRPAILLGEQVASGDGRVWFAAVRADLEALGYAVGAADLCAAGIGAPHIRQRLYFVAYASIERLEVLGEQSARRKLATAERGRAAVALANDARVGWLEGVDEREGQGDRPRPADDRWSRRLGDAGGARSRRDAGADDRAEAESSGERSLARGVGDEPLATGADGRMGDAAEPRLRWCEDAGADRDRAREGAEEKGRRSAWVLESERASLARDPWRDADWLPCIDGKARPVEPGTFPLAHGVAGRVGRLRAYGNAIVAQQAAAFVRAALEAILEAA